MHSFESGFLEKQPIPHSLLRTIRLLGEYLGKEALFRQQTPQVLESLRQVAIIQSTESSNRIEGIEAPVDRIKKLVEHKTTPKNRPEQEIAGYRDALATIHANHANMPFTVGIVLQLHRDLYQFVAQQGGRWKMTDNEISETLADGTKITRFRPTPAHRTPEAMERLHTRFRDEWNEGLIDPLLLIPAYVLDFLCIHPFTDGNGRMARLLTLLLLYRAGFEVGRYVSLEHLIENQRVGYYDALYKSSQGWHGGVHTLLPWWEYFLGVMLLGAYREFERRTGELTTARGAKTEMVIAAIRKLPAGFRYADLAQACPNVSRPTIKRVLARLREEGAVECVKSGRDAVWAKKGIMTR
ncbi:MAG: Fic family protein [Deltaproteobacteria bacterium]|nr:Fic family protein [Deltaproteobacteria bacterium]